MACQESNLTTPGGLVVQLYTLLVPQLELEKLVLRRVYQGAAIGAAGSSSRFSWPILLRPRWCTPIHGLYFALTDERCRRRRLAAPLALSPPCQLCPLRCRTWMPCPRASTSLTRSASTTSKCFAKLTRELTIRSRFPRVHHLMRSISPSSA